MNPVINAIVEDRFEIALKDARKVDNLLKTDKRTSEAKFEQNVPLLGVPVTVKESIAVEGEIFFQYIFHIKNSNVSNIKNFLYLFITLAMIELKIHIVHI